MNELSERALDYLEQVVRPEDCLFPFSTRLEHGALESSYADPIARRYTLISLLGLYEARASGAKRPLLEDLDGVVERFLKAHGKEISNAGDRGLLLALLSRADLDRAARTRLLDTAKGAAEGVSGLSIQDLCWLLWGTVEASRSMPEAEQVARAVYHVISTRYVDSRSSLPRHSLSPHRGRVVSFGAVVYYLFALYELARRFEDEQVLARFRDGTERMLELQLGNGGWPWLLDVRRGVTLDAYPLYTVHQLSMSMLFVLPAVELGVAQAPEAVERSFEWVRGSNELGIPLAVDGGKFIYRSIERRERWGRGRRYLRSMTRSLVGRDSPAAIPRRFRLVSQSRSYEWGWLLWVWSSRGATPPLVSGPRDTTMR